MQLSELTISKCNVRDPKQEDPGIKDLSKSIKENQLISKLVLRPTSHGKFEIVAGQRRYRAMLESLGEDHELKEDEYIIREDLTDDQAFLLSIEENQFRLGLSPIELNRASLKLNQMGKSDKEIAHILNVTAYRLKRLMMLSADFNKMPEAAKEELGKPLEESKLHDGHWQKIRDLEDKEEIKEVVDYIIEKEAPPRDVPTIIKAVEKAHKDDDKKDQKPKDYVAADEDKGPPADGPVEYEHKGQLTLEVEKGKYTLKVIGKGEDAEVPVDQYLEYLKHPEKFKCMVSFKLKIKPLD